MHVYQRIEQYNEGRAPDLLVRKFARLAENPFVFLRGTCHLFFEDWHGGRTLDAAPLTWISGDLHLENLGSYKGDNRLSYFDVNDFDEAALAPCTWEITRLLVSLHVAAKSLGLRLRELRVLCKAFVDAYALALADGKPRWIERTLATGMIAELFDQVARRKRRNFLDRRTRVDGERRSLIVDGEHLLPLGKKQRENLMDWFADFAKKQPNPRFYRPVDVARRVAGTGSLGLARYVALVHGKGSPNGNYLLDLKQAIDSSVATRLPKLQPHWASQASRIVQVQKRVQAISPAFLMPAIFKRTSYVLKELQPEQDRLDLSLAQRDPQRFDEVICTMGHITAWAALRGSGRQGAANADALIAFAQEHAWRSRMRDYVESYAAQVTRDWREFSRAWKDLPKTGGKEKRR